MPWLPEWWADKQFNPESSKAELTNGYHDLAKFEKKCKCLHLCKIKYLQSCLGVENVNDWILKADIRFIHFYRQCLIYWLKLNKSVFWKDKIVYQDVKCHGCGMTVYSGTQYSKLLTSPYAKNKLVHIEWVNEETMNWFVCEWCIGVCWGRSHTEYNKIKSKSKMYPKNWSGLKHYEQMIFAIQHLDTMKFPLYLAWYCIAEDMWYHGKITEIVDATKAIVQVSPLDNVPYTKLFMKLSIKNMHKYQYFLYQRPSSSLSPLYSRAAPVKLYDREFLTNDEYIIDTTCKQYKKTFTKQCMLPDGKEVFSNAFVVRILRNGTLEDTRLQSIKRNKNTFDVLSKLDFFK